MGLSVHAQINTTACILSALYNLELTILRPLRAGGLHVGLVFQHAFAAFQIHVGNIAIFGLYFLRCHNGQLGAAALGAGCADLIAFFGHEIPPGTLGVEMQVSSI